MTPQLPDSLPESPPISAFRPIQLQKTDLVPIPIIQPTPTHRLPALKTFGHQTEGPNSPPNVFSPEQQLEIDRQISIQLQEIEIAKSQRNPPSTTFNVGSTTNKKEHKQVASHSHQKEILLLWNL